jgi:cell division protein FtsB
MKTQLDIKWQERSVLLAEGAKPHAEGAKLYAEGAKLYAEGDKLYSEGDKLRAEGAKLHAEGDKLHAEGDLVFIDEAIRLCGKDAQMEYGADGSCTIQGVMHFLPL